jgi:hypothetical protein
MAGRLNPYDFPTAWGKMIIGGVYVPGIIQSIDGCEKPQRWVFQMGMSASNGVSVWKGQKLAESIKVVTRLYDKKSCADADVFSDTLLPRPGQKPPVLYVLNGALNWVKITRVSVVNIVPPKAAAGLSWDFAFELCEYNPQQKVPVGPADPPKGETENDRMEKQFSGLMDKASKFGFP